MVAIAVVMGTLAFIVSRVVDYPLRDPDGFLGPAWVRLPLLCIGAFVADIVPRTLWRSRLRPGQFKVEARLLIREHWTHDRITLVVLGLICFYVTYVSYRNLKNFLVFVRGEQDPARATTSCTSSTSGCCSATTRPSCCTTCSAPTISAHFLSWVYLFFLPMVPISVIVWLVWSRNVSFGYWFVTAQCICWTLGTASYYMIPTLGPNFAFAWIYEDLDATGVADLQDALYWGRHERPLRPARERRAVRGRVRVPARRDHPADGAGRAVHPAPPVPQDRSCGSTWASRCWPRRTSAGTTSPTTSPAR